MTYRLALALLLSSMLTGCLQTFTSVIVHRDGSAMIRDSVYLTEQIRSEGPVPADSMAVLRSKLDSMARDQAELLGPTVTVKGIRIVNEASPTGWVMEYSVPSINTLRLGRSRTMKMITSEAMPGSQDESAVKQTDEPISFQYSNGLLQIHIPQSEERPTPPEAPKAQSKEEVKLALDMMQTFFAGMHISMTVIVDGPIVQTNATSWKKSTVTLMDVDFDKLIKVWKKKPTLFRSMQGTHPTDPAGMQRALKLLPKGTLTVETRPDVSVRF